MSVIEQVQSAISPAMQGGVTGVSLFTVLAAFLEKIHGPVVTIGAVLGALWIIFQMVIAGHKYVHWLRTRKGGK